MRLWLMTTHMMLVLGSVVATIVHDDRKVNKHQVAKQAGINTAAPGSFLKSGTRQQVAKRVINKQHGHGPSSSTKTEKVIETELRRQWDEDTPEVAPAANQVPVAPTSAFELTMLAIALVSIASGCALCKTLARFDCLHDEAPDERRAIFGLRCLIVAPAWVHGAVCTSGVFASFIVHDFLQELIVKSTGGCMPLFMTAFEFLACLSFPAIQLVLEQRDLRAPFRTSHTAVQPAFPSAFHACACHTARQP